MAKIHIIGANGYVGSLLVKYLYTAGHHIEIASYRLPNIPYKSINADIVIHLAAYGGGTKHKPRNGWNDYEQMQNINVNGMKALLLGLINKNTKIIFLSSSAVYGKFKDPVLLDETAILQPISHYGIQKAEAENILINSGFEWLILRPCGIFGHSINNKFGNSFHNTVINNAIKTNKINILGGDQKIDTLYLLDLISVILSSCKKEWHSREIFNISGEITTVNNMLTILANSLQLSGVQCFIAQKNHPNQPSALMETKKLKQFFPHWKTTPLEYSMRSIVTTHIQHY